MNVELGGQLPLDASLWSELRSLQVGRWGSGDSCCVLGGNAPWPLATGSWLAARRC